MFMCASECSFRSFKETADANIRFEDLRSLLGAMGFTERTRGDQHIFSKPGLSEIPESAAAWFCSKALPGQAGFEL